MRLQLHPVLPALAPYVKLICSMQYDGFPEKVPSFLVLPDNCVELFFNYGTQTKSFVSARMTTGMPTQHLNTTGCITICFHPGKAYPFFPISMQGLTNNMVDLDYIWKEATTKLDQIIGGIENIPAGIVALQSFLLTHILKPEIEDATINFCITKIDEQKGDISIATLSEKIGLSSRQLNRRFHQKIGVSPKEYIRTTKFINALQLLKTYPTITLTEVAYESGYYDQAHFIHEVKSFAGVTPGQLAVSRNILY